MGFYRKLESAVRDLPYFEGLIIGGSEQQIAITGKGSRFNRCRVRFKNVIMSLASVTCTYTVLFHSRAVPSFDPEAMRVPEGLTFTSKTAPLWPVNLVGLREALKCQIVTVPSSEDEMSCFLQ